MLLCDDFYTTCSNAAPAACTTLKELSAQEGQKRVGRPPQRSRQIRVEVRSPGELACRLFDMVSNSRETSYRVEHTLATFQLHAYFCGPPGCIETDTGRGDAKELDTSDVIETRRSGRKSPPEENSSDDVQGARQRPSAAESFLSFRYSLSFAPSRFVSAGLASRLFAVLAIPGEQYQYESGLTTARSSRSISTYQFSFPFRLGYGCPNSETSWTRSRISTDHHQRCDIRQ